MTTELEKLREKHKEEEAIVMLKMRIAEKLPDIEGLPWKICVYTLYDRIANAYINVDNHGVLYSGHRQPTLEDVLVIAKQFPAMPLYKVKDGSISFKSRKHVDNLPKEKLDRIQSTEDIIPLMIKVNADSFRGMHKIKFSWQSDVPDIGILEISISIPLINTLQCIGYMSYRTRQPTGHTYYEDCKFITTKGSFQIWDEEQVYPIAQVSTMRWANGGREYLHDFSLVYQDQGEYDTTVADAIKYFIKIKENADAKESK